MRSALIAAIAGLYLVAAANGVWHMQELKRFLARVPALRSAADVYDLKAVVRRQMIAALAQIVLLIVPFLLFAVGLTVGVLRLLDVLWVLILNGVVGGLGVYAKSVERRVREMPAADPALAGERDHVVQVWHRRPLPDW